VAKEYASFKLVYGDLDKVDVIEDESEKADIVLSKSPTQQMEPAAFIGCVTIS
jgi:hypothetical protein